ncbi:MAG TPA: trypsin-like peptidase domain-containing protein [Solirubrobacteraceae bacterium]|nr:trypsin-like peptidase domain-containing protein [Solirubrobacteraceae bacterium]
MSVIAELQSAVAGAAERVGPSVVGLGRGWGRGSGVVTDAGIVLTNAHVLRGDEVAVAFADGRTEHGRVAGADADLDLAAIAVDTGDAPPIAWDPERPGAVGIGEPVFALANPGGRGLRTTFGLISATGRSFRGPRGRRIGGSLEHTAPLPRGSSGGPLVDAEGRLLGLNSIRLEGGLILALPADAATKRRADALAAGNAATRPRLGIALAPARASRRMRAAVGLPERDGLLVRGVERDSPAAKAGIERGDLLVGVNQHPLSSVDDLFDALEVGGELQVDLVRGTEERTVTVSLQ